MDPTSSIYSSTPYFSGGATNASGAASLIQPAILNGAVQSEQRKKIPPDQKPENKNGIFGGFLHGLKNAFDNTIKSIFTPQGILAIAAFIALNAMTGGALTPILFVAGIGFGGYQTGKGLLTGDWEQVGEGAFTLGTTYLGAKFDTKSIKHSKTDQKYGMALSSTGKAGAEKAVPTTMDNLNLLRGKKMTAADGSQKSMYKLMKENTQFNWGRMRTYFGYNGKPPASGEASFARPQIDTQA